jgi:hypothetical protein
MKINLLLFSLLFFLVSCSDDNDNEFPKNVDIEITVNASDPQRLSAIETIVYGTNLELRTNSYGNHHLPFNKMYLNQQIPELSSVNVSFRDNSVVAIGAAFEPYTIEISVEIDGETAISEQHAIDEQGEVVSITLSLTDYFAAR